MQAFRLVPGQRAGQLERRQASAVKDLVGVCVADPAEEPWVGQGSLQGVVLAHERRIEIVKGGPERFQTAPVERQEVIPPAHGHQ